MKKLKINSLIVLATAAVAIVGCSHPPTTWDPNADGKVSKTEYYTAAYETWDIDADGYVDYPEFQQKFVDSKLFSKWDDNNTSLLEEGEYQNALQEIRMTGSPIAKDFETADENKSGALDVDEFTKSLYSTWDMDGDGGVTAAEYEKSLDQFGIFANLDSDHDGSIDESDAKASLWNKPQ